MVCPPEPRTLEGPEEACDAQIYIYIYIYTAQCLYEQTLAAGDAGVTLWCKRKDFQGSARSRSMRRKGLQTAGAHRDTVQVSSSSDRMDANGCMKTTRFACTKCENVCELQSGGSVVHEVQNRCA